MAHPLAQSPVSTGAWATPFPAQPSPVSEGVAGLRDLALQGRWREVAKRCSSTTATDTATALSVAAYHVLALLKLNMNEQAAAELSKLGSYDDGAYVSGKASGGTSLVPFALRFMRAELPWRLGRRQEAVDRLHGLLQWCKEQQEAAAAAAAGRAPPDTSQQGEVWRRRQRDVLLTLVNKQCQLRQYIPALTLLNSWLKAGGSDAEVWVEAGTVQALLGDWTAAQSTLRHAEQLLLAGGSSAEEERQERQGLAHRNRGLLAFLQRDYRGAAKEFAAALALDSSDAAALNNHAVSLLYSCQLSDAAQELEAGFSRAPAAMMQEPIVTNLATLYELCASPASLAAKRRMAEWVAAAAPDDFDLACTKVAGA